ASVDSFARMRRRHEPVLPWLRWIALGTLPFLVALALANFLVLVGQSPDAPAQPQLPGAHELHGAGIFALALCTVFFVATWFLVRVRLSAGMPAADSPGAAAALALVLSVIGIAVWVVNPFAAFALLPALHLWLLVTGSPVPPSRPLGLGLIVLGL